MQTTRRVLLRRLPQLGIAVLALLSPLRLRAQRQTQWRIRRARASDAADLADIFNAHLAAGLCPYADLIDPWTVAKAEEFLSIYDGTLILDRNYVPVGFGSLTDYSDPERRRSILPETEPEVAVVALRFDRLGPGDMLDAAKTLAAAMGRELQRMGFQSCRMRIAAHPLFTANDWYVRHMTVQRTRKRDGIAHALEVSFDVAGGVAALAQEGF
jgi:hypothetical protein